MFNNEVSMEEYINKVKLNYDFYSGKDEYSDGDIEDKLLEIVKNIKDEEDLEEFLVNESEWTYLYHFSKMRHNILDWYKFEKKASLLEIGAGCGAITGLFCEKVDRVVAVDLSKKRSTINAYRNKEYDNLEIIVGNFEDIKISERFDYISLIGVLEYSLYYIDSPNPFVDMLKKVKSMLKDDGKLFVAIENKYGLKYWAGATEDHTGGFFDGIQGYGDTKRVRTFSKDKLLELLNIAGFKNNEIYYPVPDYKMPLEIYSDKYLPTKGSIHDVTPAYDRDRYVLFDEPLVYDSLCEDGLFSQFANSFLTVSQ